jgi:hypothetical protein
MTTQTREEAAAPAPGSPGAETTQPSEEQASAQVPSAAGAAREFGGRKDGTEPTRYGDWEKHGRCIDF